MPSTTADYALRAVIFLSRQRVGELVRDDIATAIGAPRNYLSKTLNALTKAGITTSSAGRYGGFALAEPAHRLTLDRVVRVFEDEPMPARCMLGNRPCNSEKPCHAHRRWRAISKTRDDALKATTIADLLE